MSDEVKTKCPHCDSILLKWLPPEDGSWDLIPQLICFNNECPYYVRGWQHMLEKYNQKASYRYRYNPQNGEEGPLPAWSDSAHRDRILRDE